MTKRKGFTLVELVVVMVIIAILAAAAVLGFSSFTKSARLTRAQEEHSALRTAANMWVAKNIKANGELPDLPALNADKGICEFLDGEGTAAEKAAKLLPVHELNTTEYKLTTDLKKIDDSAEPGTLDYNFKVKND